MTEIPLLEQGMTPVERPSQRMADPQSTRGAAPGGPPARCWADVPSSLVTNHAMECQALGTEPLGLCKVHANEILLDWPPPMPYVRARWEVG